MGPLCVCMGRGGRRKIMQKRDRPAMQTLTVGLLPNTPHSWGYVQNGLLQIAYAGGGASIGMHTESRMEGERDEGVSAELIFPKKQ